MAFDPRQVLYEQYDLSDRVCDRLFSYVDAIETAPLNLTAWSTEDVWRRGVFDSLDIGQRMPTGRFRALDIGSGAGFPGMVLAIAKPDTDWVLLDSRHRRVDFLDNTVHRLGLANVQAVAARAEEWIRQVPHERESYGVVTLRAVAPLGASTELGLPYAARGGEVFIAHGPGAESALELVQPLMRKLGGAVLEVVQHADERCSVVIHKGSSTPTNYPRAAKSLGKP